MSDISFDSAGLEISVAVEIVPWDSVSDGGVGEYSEAVEDADDAATATFGTSAVDSLASSPSPVLAGTRRSKRRPFATCLRCTKELISRPASGALCDKEAEEASLLTQKSAGSGAFFCSFLAEDDGMA